MSGRDVDTPTFVQELLEPRPAQEAQLPLAPLLQAPLGGDARPGPPAAQGVVLGEVLAVTDGGSSALVRLPGAAPGPALQARSTVDLHAAHIGQSAVLMFENADPARPIVVGVLRGQPGWPLEDRAGSVELAADGERLVVSARRQLVLQCGQASITLTEAGRVLIRGSYVLTSSTGMNRIQGGAVQIN